MAWNQRIRQAAYTSPNGTRTVLTYDDVGRTVEKRTTAFNFPDAPGTYVQDLGHSGRQYPLRLFFWGNDYDLAANAFEDSLLEIGPGTLEHPIYGRVLVVPFGAITRRDDLVSGTNQAVIEVTFWETIPDIYPLSQDDAASLAAAALAAFNAGASGQFAALTKLKTAVEKSSFIARYNVIKNATTSGLARIASATDAVKRTFDTINQSINAGLDTFVGDPLALGFQTLALIQAPAQALTLIQARLDGYRNLLAIVLNGGVATPGNDSQAANTFQTADLYGAGYISGQVASVLNNEFKTKTDALTAADAILNQFDAWVAWRDANFASLGEIDTGATYQTLQQAVTVTTAYLVGLSFSLKQERALVLANATNVLALVSELYGDVDQYLDFFILSNNLTGSEILELPKGRRVVYYA